MNLYTYTGQIAYPGGAPSLFDIAVSLCREGRYAGAGVYWWPVALHSFVVADLLPAELRIHGLLHDAAECIIGDVPKPAKIPAIELLEDRLLDGIYRGLRIPYPSEATRQLVHEADRRTLHGEVHTVGTRALRELYPHDERAEELVELYRKMFPVEDCVQPHGKAVGEFLYRFERYRDFSFAEGD